MYGQMRDMLAGENDDDCLLRAMAVRVAEARTF